MPPVGEASAGLEALRECGAEAWPEPTTMEDFVATLQRSAPVESRPSQPELTLAPAPSERAVNS